MLLFTICVISVHLLGRRCSNRIIHSLFVAKGLGISTQQNSSWDVLEFRNLGPRHEQ